MVKEEQLHNMEQGSTSKTRPKQQFTPTQPLRKALETHVSSRSGFGRLPVELGFQGLPFRVRLLLGKNELPSVTFEM